MYYRIGSNKTSISKYIKVKTEVEHFSHAIWKLFKNLFLFKMWVMAPEGDHLNSESLNDTAALMIQKLCDSDSSTPKEDGYLFVIPTPSVISKAEP